MEDTINLIIEEGGEEITLTISQFLSQDISGKADKSYVDSQDLLRVEKVAGYSLTKNDLTDLLKTAYDSAVAWISTNGSNLINHLTNTSNPHSVTKSQVGLSNVPNLTFSGTNTGDQDLSSFATSTELTDGLELKVDKVLNKSLLLDTQITKLTQLSGGRTEVDFGALPIYEKEFTITDASVIATSNITASLAYEAPTNKDLDELEMDSLSIVCGQASAGSFKMFVKSIDSSYLADKFKINYSITI